MKLTRKTKRIMKNVLLGLLGVGLLIGVVSLVSNLVNKADEDTKEIHPTFEVGGLTEDGKYLDTEKSIYTKKSFECKGLNVKLDFDADVTYQIYFYDELDEFVSKTDVLSVGYNDEIPSNVELARIVITPNYTDDVEDEDKVVKWYEVRNYVKQLTISVAKEQSNVYEEIEETLADDEFIFILDGTQYKFTFEEGMTWSEFAANSSLSQGQTSCSNGEVLFRGQSTPFSPDDLVISQVYDLDNYA